MRILCKLGLHWKMRHVSTLFVDCVNRQPVFLGECSCGKRWMHQSINGLPWFKVLHHTSHAKPEDSQ